MDVQVLEDPAQACAELLCEAASDGQHIVLTGGSTPGVEPPVRTMCCPAEAASQRSSAQT